MAKLKDRGFFSLTIEDAHGEEVTQDLNLWKVCNYLHRLQLDFQGKSIVDFHDAVAEYLKELGYPTCSHQLADDFIATIRDAVAKTQKKSDGNSSPSADLPDSTASMSAT